MADISLTLSNLQDTIEKASSSIKTLDSAFSEMSDALKDHVDKVDKSTKKQEDAIKRQQQAVDKLTRSIQNNLSSITSEFTKQIPIIGKSLQNGIDSILKGMQRPLEALSRFVLGNKNLSGVLTAAGGGLLASAALIFKEFQKIENAVVSISKQTGFYGQQLKNVRDMTIEAYKGNLQFGISMEKNAKSAIGLVTALGSQRRITQDLIKFNAQLADYTGLSADQTGKLMSTMIKGFGMTTNQVKNFIGQLATATAGGQATATIIRDMAANSNLVAMHAAKGAQYLLDMSAYSRLTNVNMNKMQSMTDVFLNFDSGTELINKLNVAFGGSLNSMEMFSKAMKGDVVGVMDDLHGLLSSPQGLRTLQMYPGYARQLGQQLGMSYDEMLKIAKMTKSDLELAKQQQGEQARINDILREQRTTFENMKNILISEFLPGFTNLAQRAMTMVKPLKEGVLHVRDIYRQFREMLGGSDVKAISTIAVAIPTLIAVAKGLIGRGSAINPLWVRDVSGGVDGYTGSMFGDYREGRRSGMNRRDSAGLAGLNKMGRMGRVGMGVAALGTVGAAASFLGGGDAIDKVLSLITMIAPFFGPVGMGIGAGAAALGVLKNTFIDKAATGRVVGSPSLFMVGEENRREVIIPTERIRNGMPVSSDVANELASIGVPGFFDGGTVGGFATAVGGPGYGNRNRGSVASSGSIGEQKRREQESRSINEAYRRDLKDQHNQRLEALINIERNTADTSTLLGGSGGGGLTNVSYRFPRRRGGGGLNIDPIKDMPKDFMNAFKQGFLNEYQEWRKSLVGDQRQTVELLHDLYDMYGIYGKQGMRGVYRHAATDKGVEQRLDWIISKIGGSGSFIDRESMALTQGLRAGMMSDVLGGSWKQNLGVGLSTTLFSSGVYRMQNALDYRNYNPPQLPQLPQPPQPETPASTGEPIVLWAPSPLEGEGVGLRDPRNVGPRINELYSFDRSLMTNFDSGLTGTIRARGEASILNRIKRSRMGQAIGDRYQRAKQGFGKLFEGSQQMVKDPETGAMVPTGEKGGFFSSAAGGAALQGLGAAGLQLATGGFGKKNVGAAVSTGFSAAGAALSTMGPYGMVAGLGLNIIGGLIGNKIVGSSKAVKRSDALANLQKAIQNQNLSTFSSSSRKKLKEASEKKSSRGRTLVAIQSMFANAGLNNNEIGNLFSYLTKTNIDKETTAFWNKRLFGKESETLNETRYQDLQTQMSKDDAENLDELQASAENILERWRKDRGYESEAEALADLGIKPEEARDITKLTTAISQRSGGSQFLERHMMSMSEEEYAEAQSGGGGGGGEITMPPELTQYMLELNNNVRKMGQELGSQTFNVIIKMDSREVAQAVVEAQSETANYASVG